MTPGRTTGRPLEGSEHSDKSICIGCGLCCDGTLYSFGVADARDEAPASAIGLQIVDIDGKRGFLQPCAQFSCGQCRVYESRPPVCRGYRCALLDSVNNGTIMSDEARRKIVKAKDLVDALAQTNPEARTPRQRKALAERLQLELPASSESRKREIGSVLLKIAALDLFLARWFHRNDADEATRQR